MFVLDIQVIAETYCLRGDGLYQVASYSSCTLVILQNYLVSAMKDDLNPQFCCVSPVNLLASVFQRFDTELIHECAKARWSSVVFCAFLMSEETGDGTSNCQLKSEEG